MRENQKIRGYVMIDFIFAGMIYLALMLGVLFCFLFITIGITCAAAAFIRRCMYWTREPNLALK